MSMHARVQPLSKSAAQNELEQEKFMARKKKATSVKKKKSTRRKTGRPALVTVSYTHLTLPTIYSV